MQIIFGPHLDGLQPSLARSAVGEVTLGPKGMLDTLETQLGIPTPNLHPSEALFGYLQCLRSVSSANQFFHRSLEVDPVSVARTLLNWREQWYEAGWAGTFPSDVPARLADMAAIEAHAQGRVPPTRGERLQSILKALAMRDTQVENVELHTPVADLPYMWQQLFSVLPNSAGLGLQPAGHAGSDLARVQAKLLSLVDEDEPVITTPERLAGDGSLLVVKSASKDLSADTVAEFLLATGRIDSTLLIAENEGIILDNALERAGLPRCGFRRYTRFRAATQVLKLSLALMWEPVDPHRVLQVLLHSTGPLPRWARSRLADAVAESPGIGGPAWANSVSEIGRVQRERFEAEEAEIERLRAEIQYWFEREMYDPDQGAPIDSVIAHTQRVSMWASAQSHSNTDNPETSLFAAAHAQAEALLTELAGLRKANTARISRLALEKRIDEVTTEAPDPTTYEEAGHARATTSAATVTSIWPTVIWWNLLPSQGAIRYSWSKLELAALRASGVRLPKVESLVGRQSRDWLRPVCHARERLILVVHDAERGLHPLWTRIQSLFENLLITEIEPALLGGEKSLTLLDVPTRTLTLKPLPARRRWWLLPADCTVTPREMESYSSLSKLCDYPHQWVLQYAARLRGGRAAQIRDGSRLFGQLGHRLFEEFFRTQEDWRGLADEDALSWVRAQLPLLIEKEGAVLLGAGRGVQNQRVTAALETAIVRLLMHLRSASVEHVAPEAMRDALFAGRTLTGTIDMVLTRSNGQRNVLDIKWASESYRRDLLSDNRALQLATYSYLQKNQDETNGWPPGAYFILSTGNILAHDEAYFPHAVASPPRENEGVADLWGRLLRTCDWRWAQLQRNQIEVVTKHTDPDAESSPPEDGLRSITGGDRFDNFIALAGWEDFV